ncbi:hypothetical protein ACLOAV_009855 [Pseudogymnoascus australis]
MEGDNTASIESSPTGSSTTSKWSQVSIQTPEETEAARLLEYHLGLLRLGPAQKGLQDVTTAPIFTKPVLEHVEAGAAAVGDSSPAFPQYGLLAGTTETGQNGTRPKDQAQQFIDDPRIFFNVAAPSSTFICGSQGSGKSHTLSCLLENCLIPSDANKLPRTLTGLVFHYDTFISDEVEPLRISEENLNTKRMLDLMAVSRGDGPMPLYLHAVNRILREMRIEQQEMGTGFSYAIFKDRIDETEMSPAQLSPLAQRLDTLESFMPNTQTGAKLPRQKGRPVRQYGNDWASKPGTLTIVDLSCPCVTAEGACSLFNMCLSIFVEQSMKLGKVIALDEAHKFMTESAEAQTLTETLLSTIRLQRHLGARIIISTQEPTISPDLLDLCSVTIVHRFTSPEWMRTLKAHLAAAASDMTEPEPIAGDPDSESNSREKSRTASMIFREIVGLEVGEALVFSPSAMVGVGVASSGGSRYIKLGAGFLKVRVRARLTTDGGKSVLAA